MPDLSSQPLGVDAEENEDLEMLLDGFDQYAAENIHADRIDAAHAIAPEILADLAEMGFFGLSLPEEYGGAGFGLPAVCKAVAHIAQRDRSVATTVGLHLGLGTRGMVAFGSEALKQRYLPQLATGEAIAAFAATEPGAGSDLTRIATRLRLEDDALTVRGSKIFVTNGGFANVFTLLTASPGLGGVRRGHSLVVVERGDRGVEVGPEEDKLGLRGSSTVSVHLDAVPVDEGRVVGGLGQGMAYAGHVLSWGRTVMASGCVGAAREALALTARHVLVRHQFGKPLAEHPVVRQQVADMAARLFAMDALVQYASSAEDPAVLSHRSTSAKIACSEGDWLLCDRAIQLHGGSGFIEESGVPLLLRDARVTRIFEGANDVLLSHLGTLAAVKPLGSGEPIADGSTPLRTSLQALVALRDDRQAAFKEQFGIRLFRRPRRLAQLGRLTSLVDASVAAVMVAERLGTDEAFALAEHWLRIASTDAQAYLHEPTDQAAVDAVAENVYAGARP